MWRVVTHVVLCPLQVWDEAKRLRCEWYNDYEKTATKPPVVIADLEVIELNFRGQ